MRSYAGLEISDIACFVQMQLQSGYRPVPLPLPYPRASLAFVAYPTTN